MAYQCTINGENKNTAQVYCSDYKSYKAEQLKRRKRNYVRQKQAARMRFLIIFFTIFGLLVPIVFIHNFHNVFLKRFNNINIVVPKEVSYLDAAEFSIADNTFLDTRYIDPVNTENPVMSSPVMTARMPNLTRKLKNLMASYPRLKPGIFIWDYSTGKYVAINPDKEFSAASIIKIPLLFQLFKRSEKGLADLNESMSTKKAFISGGSGALQYFPLGSTFTVKRLGELTIQQSDNTASNMLLAAVGGMNELNRAMKNWGFSKSHFYEWLPDLKGKNVTTPAEIGKMLYNIDNPDFFSLSSRAQIVEIMANVKNRYLIHAGLPYRTQFLHKTGDIATMLGDAGTVILPDERKYIIVIMVKRPWNDYSAKQFIVEASEIAYKSISRKRF